VLDLKHRFVLSGCLDVT